MLLNWIAKNFVFVLLDENYHFSCLRASGTLLLVVALADVLETAAGAGPHKQN